MYERARRHCKDDGEDACTRAERRFCCCAGGARMWMEEHIGKRVNTDGTVEAMDTGATTIATGWPFCRVMMTDGVDEVAAVRETDQVEVLDVAQLLLGSLDLSSVKLPEKGEAAAAAAERAKHAAEIEAAQAGPGHCVDRAGRRKRTRC